MSIRTLARLKWHEARSLVSGGGRRKSLTRRRLLIRLPLACEFLCFGDLLRCHLVGGISFRNISAKVLPFAAAKLNHMYALT